MTNCSPCADFPLIQARTRECVACQALRPPKKHAPSICAGGARLFLLHAGASKLAQAPLAPAPGPRAPQRPCDPPGLHFLRFEAAGG